MCTVVNLWIYQISAKFVNFFRVTLWIIHYLIGRAMASMLLRDVNKGLTPKDQDKDLTPKDQDKDLTPKDKDKDLTPKDQDKDKDFKYVLKESLRTRASRGPFFSPRLKISSL